MGESLHGACVWVCACLHYCTWECLIASYCKFLLAMCILIIMTGLVLASSHTLKLMQKMLLNKETTIDI